MKIPQVKQLLLSAQNKMCLFEWHSSILYSQVADHISLYVIVQIGILKSILIGN